MRPFLCVLFLTQFFYLFSKVLIGEEIVQKMGKIPICYFLGWELIHIFQHLYLGREFYLFDEFAPKTLEFNIQEGHFDSIFHVMV